MEFKKVKTMELTSPKILPQLRQKKLRWFAPSDRVPLFFCHLFRAFFYGKCLILRYAVYYPC